MQAGLAMTFIEAPLQIQERAKGVFPQFITDQCTKQDIPVSGNAAGHSDPFDLTGLPSGPYPQNNGWHGKGIAAMFGCVPDFPSSPLSVRREGANSCPSCSCVLTAVLGMGTVGWYAWTGKLSEEEIEDEERRKAESKKTPFWKRS